MSYYTYDAIKGLLSYQNARAENQVRRSLPNRIVVFLSHSHEDADIILPAINFLLSTGVTVYVDWLDDDMPKITSSQTAERIKTKIMECSHFVVLLTENSRNSKWVPWELGFADGKKRIHNIGILPIKRSSYTGDYEFSGLEFMSLYPVISSGVASQTGLPSPVIFPPARIGGEGRVLGRGWLEIPSPTF
jgi:hypothetical protein